MRRLRAGANVAHRSREALGIRPAPLSGSATEAGWTGTGERREIAVRQVPGSADQALKRRDGTSRGVAVCLYFPAIRETSRGRYQGAPFGVPPPSLLVEGGPLKLPFTRRHLRAAMTLAWRKESIEMRERTTHTPSYAGLTRVSIHLRKSLSRGWMRGSSPRMTKKSMDGRVKPGHDEKPVHGCVVEAVNPRKNP
jgi:hypothetical protein